MLIHYIETYFSAGKGQINRATQAIKEYGVIPDDNEFSEGVIGYRFFDRSEQEIDGELLKGESKNFSANHWFGEELSEEEIENNELLHTNCKASGHRKFVKTNNGSVHALHYGDLIVPPLESLKDDKP